MFAEDLNERTVSMGFFERVYEQVKKIAKGKFSTYGQIAASIGVQ